MVERTTPNAFVSKGSKDAACKAEALCFAGSNPAKRIVMCQSYSGRNVAAGFLSLEVKYPPGVV